MTEKLYDVYEPVPARCEATQVTMDNIHVIAGSFRGSMTAHVEYNVHGATLQLHRDAYTPPGSDEEVPAFDLTVKVGEMLVQHRAHPGRVPLVLHEGWNTVTDPWEFQTQWRKT